MTALSIVLVSVASVAFLASGKRLANRVLGGVAGLTSLTLCLRSWGGIAGTLAQLVVAMGAASILVLVLPHNRKLALPLAAASVLTAFVLLALGGSGS